MGKAQGIEQESGKVYRTLSGLPRYGYIPEGQGDHRSWRSYRAGSTAHRRDRIYLSSAIPPGDPSVEGGEESQISLLPLSLVVVLPLLVLSPLVSVLSMVSILLLRAEEDF